MIAKSPGVIFLVRNTEMSFLVIVAVFAVDINGRVDPGYGHISHYI